MREIFTPRKPRDPGHVFYTIRPEDVGKNLIPTEIGNISVKEFIGRVLKHDVGKRLYRVCDLNGQWFWQMENDTQYNSRIGAVRE